MTAVLKMDHSDAIDDCSRWAVTYAKYKVARDQNLENRMARGVRTAQIMDLPRRAEVAIDGVLDLQNKNKLQPPRMTRRIWAELDQRAKEKESKTPRPSRLVLEGHAGWSAQKAGGPGRSAGGPRPTARRSTHSSTPRGTQRMSFKEQQSREKSEREKARRAQQSARLCKDCGFWVWYPMSRDKNTNRTNWYVYLDSATHKTNVRRNSIRDTSCLICPGKIFECPADWRTT